LGDAVRRRAVPDDVGMTLAHAGHWYHALLYLAPVIVISIALWRSGAREEREPSRQPDGEPQVHEHEHEHARGGPDELA
jgi:hypothetical protein